MEASTSSLMVEQNVTKALSIAPRACVLHVGWVVAQGTGRELLSDGQIRRAYPGH